MRIQLASASLLLVAACASKAPVDDDFSALSGQDEKADAFSTKMKIVGSLDYGQTSASSRYTKTPKYRAFKFGGNAGDQVDVWVRSNNGDAVAWVLDNDFHIIGSNDDADDTTFDAHVAVTLPANPSIAHYVVYRDYDLATHYFTVSLAGASSQTCVMDSDCARIDVPIGTVAECNNGSHACETVAIDAIHCGGFINHPHGCPDGYVCHYDHVPDVGGSCIMQ